MMSVISLLISLLLANLGAADQTSRCDGITLGKANYQDWINFSPFYFYFSTAGVFNCSVIQLVNPAGTDTSYSGTAVIINGNNAITNDETLVDNSILKAHNCSDGEPTVYRLLYSNIHGTGNASYCLFICDSQGVNITTLFCVGRTPEDEAYIENYLNTDLKVPITGPLYRSQSNCPTPKSCVAFT